MRILYYSPHPDLNLADPAGYATHMNEMINAFRKLGHEVIPVIRGGTTRSESKQSSKDSTSFKRKILTIIPPTIKRTVKDYLLLKFDKKSEAYLEQKIKEFNPDLIYERAYYMCTSGVMVAKKLSIKHCLETNAPLVEENRYFSKGLSLFYKTALKKEKEQIQNTGLAIFVTAVLRDYFLKRIPGLKTEKTLVTPNCIDPEKIVHDENKKKNISEKYKLKGYTVIGFVGSIFPYHGVDILVDAFDKVLHKNAQTKLLIVGNGASLDEIQKHAKTLPSFGNMVFTGSVKHSEVFPYIETMDITVMAKTNWYGSPLKLLEYGAMGKAIIAPDEATVKELMTNNADGLLTKPDVASLAEALIRLIENPEMCATYAANFKTKVLANYTWTNSAQQVLSAIK